MADTLRKAIAEFVGAFALVFVGAGAIISTRDRPDLLLVALAHGLTIGVMASATAHISGGHFNPAVTFGALVGRQISLRLSVVYWIAQLLGGLVAASALLGVFPSGEWRSTSLGTPQVSPGVGIGPAILVEAVLTFFLVFVVYGTAIDPKGAFRAVGGLAIGFTVALDIMMGGPLTGAAMNPARWFGPGVVAGLFDNWFVYWIGPLAGGLIAGLVYGRVLLEPSAKP
ncbi:MAG TPA: aquaporin [Thermoplasmata archaeon]|nr:aquaporin [Thermoplasmata archaeon]